MDLAVERLCQASSHGKKIKWEKIMMLNMSAYNYKSTVPMSFIRKQIWLPPLFPTVRGIICVIATLEKMNELLEVFFKLLRGFVCHRNHSIDRDVSNLAWLSPAQLYSRMPAAPCSGQGRQHPGWAGLPRPLRRWQLWLWHVSWSAACCAWGWVAGWFRCVRLQSTAFLV